MDFWKHRWRCRKIRQREKRQIAQFEEKFRIMAGQGIVKEYFSLSMSLQNEPENSPLQEVLIFCCHKCHNLWHKVLNNRKIGYCINIYSNLYPKTERKREKQAVVLGKTTRCFWENDTLFLGKRHIVFSKTSRRLKMSKPKKQKNVIMG